MTDENLPKLDVPLLRKAVEWAEAEAASDVSHWEQASWLTNVDDVLGKMPDWMRDDAIAHRREQGRATCGTTYCIAGYVGQLLEPRYQRSAFLDGGVHVSAFAREALGLSEDDADRLFCASNSITDVRAIATEFAERAGDAL